MARTTKKVATLIRDPLDEFQKEKTVMRRCKCGCTEMWTFAESRNIKVALISLDEEGNHKHEEDMEVMPGGSVEYYQCGQCLGSYTPLEFEKLEPVEAV